MTWSALTSTSVATTHIAVLKMHSAVIQVILHQYGLLHTNSFLDGSWTCTCREGFTGDGMECNDINECLDTSGLHFGVCPDKAHCLNIGELDL